MIELWEIGRSAAMLLVVLGLVLALGWGAKRLKLGPAAAKGGPGRRLQVVESLFLDPRTRLVLVRHDGAEHLLLVGANGGQALRSTGEERP